MICTCTHLKTHTNKLAQVTLRYANQAISLWLCCSYPEFLIMPHTWIRKVLTSYVRMRVIRFTVSVKGQELTPLGAQESMDN